MSNRGLEAAAPGDGRALRKGYSSDRNQQVSAVTDNFTQPFEARSLSQPNGVDGPQGIRQTNPVSIADHAKSRGDSED